MIFFSYRMDEVREVYRPGQKVLALVDGVEQVVILSLETEEKGDRRDHCWRYCQPWYPIIPRSVTVEPIRAFKDPIVRNSRTLAP
jgi:hypothetical protein